MDGKRNYSSLPLRALVMACCAFALMPHLFAELPPLFVSEGAESINKANESARPIVLRPRARVIPVSETTPLETRLPSGSELQAAVNPAQPTKQISVEEALETKGSITFRKTPLSEVVFLLSDLWNINIVAGENISGEVSGAFHSAPLREVLSAALTAAGYSYRRTGNSLVVLPIDEVGADNPDFTSEAILLPPALSGEESTLAAAQLLLSERGKLQRIGSEAILVVDSRERIDRIRSLLSDLTPAAPEQHLANTEESEPAEDQFASMAVTRSGIAYFTLQFTEAQEMAQPLSEALGDSVVVAVYPEENRIMVKGTAEDLRLASEAIEQLDRPRPQVRITAMIYDVSLKEIERLGVDWSARPHSRSLTLSDLNDTESLRFRNAVSATTGLISDPSASGAANLAISTLNNTFDVDTLLQALDTSSEAKLLADPSITVGDRREASIRIVQKIPIIAADPVESSGVVFSQVQFEEAGVILNVQPRISRDGTVEMVVQPEYSVVADFIENNPVIDSRTAQTTVRVADGQTFALGGLRQKSIVETIRGVPGLRDIKFIGKLFRSHDTEIRESELIVFIKPEVVTPYFGGKPREQVAACMAGETLDAIPHATQTPLTPCCKDPNCPNHHPRPRINGGSRSLEMIGDYGIGTMLESQTEVEIINHPTPVEHTTTEPTTDVIAPTPIEVEVSASEVSSNVTISDVYPPLHIDQRGMLNN